MRPKLFASISIILTLKVIVAAFTPLSDDFLSLLLFAYSNTYPGPYFVWILLTRVMYDLWLLIPVAHEQVPVLLGYWYFKPSPAAFLLILMGKAPLIMFDMLCAVLLYKIVLEVTHSQSSSLTAALLWLANPYVTFIAEMFGAYDIAVVFIFLVSVYFFIKHRYTLSAVFAVVSIFLKPYPLILLPLFIIVLAKQRNVSGTLRFILASLIFSSVILVALHIVIPPDVLTSVTDYYFSKGLGFFQGFVVEMYTSMTGSTIPMFLSLAFLFYVVFLLAGAKLWALRGNEKIFDLTLSALLILFAFSYWHPQYLLIIVPFLVLDQVIRKTHYMYSVGYLVIGFVTLLYYFGFYFSSMTHSFFFIPNYTPELQAMSDYLFYLHQDKLWTPFTATLARSLFAGVSLFYLSKLFVRHIPFEKFKEHLGMLK